MKIIIENTTFCKEFAKKMSEFIKGSISVETFEEASLDEFSSVVVTFSFNCKSFELQFQK